MPEVSIKDQIKKLVELQKVDKEIFDFNQELDEKPAILGDAKESFESKQQALNDIEEKLKAVQLARKEQELELSSKEADIAKGNTQLSQLKTNKEYTAKLTELETLKADKSRFEEKILLSFDEGDKVSANIEAERKILADEEKKYSEQKKEIEALISQLQEKVQTLESKRNQLTPDVDKSFLERYEKILKKKDGLAIVPVEGSICGGCFMDITQQVTNEIKMHEKLLICEMCARMIYSEDAL